MPVLGHLAIITKSGVQGARSLAPRSHLAAIIARVLIPEHAYLHMCLPHLDHVMC